jgi:hypothetical protein
MNPLAPVIHAIDINQAPRRSAINEYNRPGRLSTRPRNFSASDMIDRERSNRRAIRLALKKSGI